MRFAVIVLMAVLSGGAEATDWRSSQDLPGVRWASDEERDAVIDELRGTWIADSLRGQDVLIHDGELKVSGALQSGHVLVVRGDLVVEGIYDDNRGRGLGVTIVMGGMRATHIYSKGGLYVRDDLHVDGMLMAVHDNFSFEVSGKVHADGLVIQDKSARFGSGRIGFAFVEYDHEPTLHAAGLRRLLPELFTAPGHRDMLGDEDTLEDIWPDHDQMYERIQSGKPIVRDVPAAPELVDWLAQALDPELDEASLLRLVGRDRLVDQLLASIHELSDTLALPLKARGDEIVLQWLVHTRPDLMQDVALPSLTAGLAKEFVANRSTSHRVLERIASHPDAMVRITLSGHRDLPIDLARTLALDDDPAVRAAVLAAGFNALALEPIQIDQVLEHADDPVRNALAGAMLDVEQARVLLPRLSAQGMTTMAGSLLRQHRGAQPSRLSTDERTSMALTLFERGGRYARTAAFLCLPVRRQLALLELLLTDPLNVDDHLLLMTASEPELLARLVDIAEQARTVPEILGRNPALPPRLQQRMAELAFASEGDTGDRVLRDLLQNDSLSDAVMLAIAKHALARGYQHYRRVEVSLLGRQDLSVETIALLDARLRRSEDWALTLLMQRHASSTQIQRAISGWHDDQDDVLAEAEALRALEGIDYFAALAKARSAALREVAARNANTPLTSILNLLDDRSEAVRWIAHAHPSVPSTRLKRLARRAPAHDVQGMPLDEMTWRVLADERSSLLERMLFWEQAAQARLRARLQEDQRNADIQVKPPR